MIIKFGNDKKSLKCLHTRRHLDVRALIIRTLPSLSVVRVSFPPKTPSYHRILHTHIRDLFDKIKRHARGTLCDPFRNPSFGETMYRH